MGEAFVGFGSIQRPTVVHEIIDRFEERLIRGQIRVGQRLPPEAELAQQFAVGRSAVREAMKKLEALGVVDIRQGDGTYIVDRPSPALLNPLAFAIMLQAGMTMDLLELRFLIQAGYCQLAAHKADEEDWRRIEQASQAFEACAQTRPLDMDEFTNLDLVFHDAILEATHNPLVIRLGGTVERLFFASIRSTLSRSDGREWGLSWHRNIVSAMQSGDDANIRQAVAHSLRRWGSQLGAIAET